MKKVLITGENSYIGKSFAAWVAANASEIECSFISLRDESWSRQDFSEYDSILHVAGIAHADTGSITKEEQDAYYQVNTELTLEVARKAADAGVNQFIYMSSSIVYGDSAPMGCRKMITADTKVSPKDFYGDSKVKAEEGLLALARGEDVMFEGMELSEEELRDVRFKVCIVRCPMVYGPGSKGNYPVLSRMAQTIPVFPDIVNERSMIYIGNLCKFLSLMVLNSEEGIFHPQNQAYVSTNRLVEEIRKNHGGTMYPTRLATGTAFFASRLSAWKDNKYSTLVNKVFGNLTYDKALSEYKEPYQIYKFRESIRLTEGRFDVANLPGESRREGVCAGTLLPSVSVVTICYNAAKDLPRTIESVLYQSCLPEEYILVDGASTDKSLEVIESYRDAFESRGVRFLVSSEPDRGIYDAMNKGVARATGDIVGILNAGDWYEKDAIRQSAETFSRTGCDLTFGNIAIHRNGPGATQGYRRDGSPRKKPIAKGGSFVTKKGKKSGIYQTSRDWNHPTMFVKTALSKENPYAGKGIHDDYAFYLKMVKSGAHIETIDSILAHFQMGGASNHKSLAASGQRIRDRYEYCYKENGFSSLYLLECVGIEAIKYLL